ncbi:O-methyltransferase-like protein [Sphaerisporangium siamense]|uniref:O-methyltransferase involved in polyketide biosynthesis n=1 Tax=Sphaerisporangium siamense TaxID=795645 RepID=A0A7W7DEX2_9ACTN|nr:class I SAM-dependent methyltransferase [Sphaerisporangium siamense]MBB4704481.1 O-methyltransferase involved in polyketide biosynthesis [Sphaerisporangium siamense]GII86091.1 O-methyltransferase-like protein [Sphaerisporangium siamense]
MTERTNEGAGEEKLDVAGLLDGEVTWTLLGTLYLRAWESRAPRSILSDHYAAEALARIDHDFSAFERRLRPRSNQYLVALRARGLDDWGAAFLARHPDATVLQLGCGLDSRMLRLAPPPGVRWFDLDMPDVIAVRRRLYPEHDGYRLIAASVTDSGWLDQVPADRATLIVAEGLLPYLAPDEVRRLLQRLTGHFTTGELIFDALAPWLARLGKPFRWGIRDAREIERWNPHLKCLAQVPFTTHATLIPSRRYRTLYRLGDRIPFWRTMSQNFRFTWPA